MNLSLSARVLIAAASVLLVSIKTPSAAVSQTVLAPQAWESIAGVPLQDQDEVDASAAGLKENADSESTDSERSGGAEQAQRLASLKELQRVESSVEALIPVVTPCIVSIGETASGVIVKPTGIVITASHVTRHAGRLVVVRLHDGRVVKGVTLGSNAANDTSAIQLLGAGPWPYLKTVTPGYTAEAGQWSVAFGYPLNWPRDKPASARLGRVTGQYRGKIVTDCPIMGGDSGGALVDTNGHLLGINSSVRLDVTQNLHVPIARYREDWRVMMSRQDVDIVTAKPVAADVAQAQTPQQSQQGQQSTPADPQVKPTKKTGKPYLGIYGESAWNGVRIRDVRRESPAEKGGLRPSDVIQQINGSSISSFAMLLKYLSGRQDGEQVVVRVNRFGANLDFVLTLESR